MWHVLLQHKGCHSQIESTHCTKQKKGYDTESACGIQPCKIEEGLDAGRWASNLSHLVVRVVRKRSSIEYITQVFNDIDQSLTLKKGANL